MNKYTIMKGSDYSDLHCVYARFYVIDNDTKHYLFYTDDPKNYIIALNFYAWTIIGVNDSINMNRLDALTID